MHNNENYSVMNYQMLLLHNYRFLPRIDCDAGLMIANNRVECDCERE